MAEEEDIVRPRRQLVSNNRSSRKRSFSYEHIDGARLPIVYRNGKKYISVRMAEAALLSRYPNVIPPTLMTGRKCWSLYVTPAEAALLNETNAENDFLYGQTSFTTNDVVVELPSLMDFYDIVRDCIMPVSQDRRLTLGGGWLQINDTICPYVWRNQVRWVPLTVVILAAERPLAGPDADDCEGSRASGSRSSSSADKSFAQALDRRNILRITVTEAAFLNALCVKAGRDYCFDLSTEMISLVDVKLASNVIVVDLPPSVDPFSWARCIVGADAGAVESFKQEVQSEWDKWKQSMSSALGHGSPAKSEPSEVYESSPVAASSGGSVSPEPPAVDHRTVAKLSSPVSSHVVDVPSASESAAGSRKKRGWQDLLKPCQLSSPSSVKAARQQSRSPTEEEISMAGSSDQDPDTVAIVDSLVAHFPDLQPVVRDDRGGACDPDVLRLIAWFVHVQQRIFEALRRQMCLIDKLTGVDKLLRSQCRFIVTDMLSKPAFWVAKEHDIPKRLQALLHYAMSTVLLGMRTHNLLSFLAGGLFNAHTPAALENFAFVRSVVVVALTAQGLHPPLLPSAAYQSVAHTKTYLMSCVAAWSNVKCDILHGLDNMEAWGVTLFAVYDRVYGFVLGTAAKAKVHLEDVVPRRAVAAEKHDEPSPAVELRPLGGSFVPCVRRSHPCEWEWWVPLRHAARALFPTCTVDEFTLVVRDVVRLPLSYATSGEHQRLRSLVASEFSLLALDCSSAAEACRMVELRALHKSIGLLHYWLSRSKACGSKSAVGVMPMASQTAADRGCRREDSGR